MFIYKDIYNAIHVLLLSKSITLDQPSPASDFLVRPVIVKNYSTQVCEAFGDPDTFTTYMDRLNCVIQEASKCLGLDFGQGDLQSQRLYLLMQHFESYHQNLH